PAPAPRAPAKMPRALYGVDVFTPNQVEARMLARSTGSTARNPDWKQVASHFLGRGAGSVVLKLGARGSILADRATGFRTAKPFKVKVVDTTAAGDAFTAALAVARAEGVALGDSLRFANAAGAACCPTCGGQ